MEESKEEIKDLSVREEVINDLMNRNIRLSYSALKNFTSPINLVNYLVKKKTKTDIKTAAQLEGTASDIYLLEPHNYDKKIAVVDSMPTTDNQVAFVQELIAYSKANKIPINDMDEEFAAEVVTAYNRSSDAKKAFISLKPYLLAMASEKTIIDSATNERVKELTDALTMQEDVAELMGRISDVQKRLEWEDEGWNFIAYLDMELEEEDICDVKRTKDATPDLFERDIRYNKYYFQGGMYCYAYYLIYNKLPNYKILAYDATFNYDIFNLDYTYIQYGIQEYRYRLEQLNKAVEEGAFWKSYGFFKPQRRVYKPKWVEGFELQKPLPHLYKPNYEEPPE